MSHRPRTVVLCQYIKANGLICRSPALRNHCFCYFHQHWHNQRTLLNIRLRRRARALDRAGRSTLQPGFGSSEDVHQKRLPLAEVAGYAERG